MNVTKTPVVKKEKPAEKKNADEDDDDDDEDLEVEGEGAVVDTNGSLLSKGLGGKLDEKRAGRYSAASRAVATMSRLQSQGIISQ